jgi:hypothetical protein
VYRAAVQVLSSLNGSTRMAQDTITRLITAGCAVLCLTPDSEYIHTYAGPTTITVADPADCATLIGHGTARALVRH